jgi:bifunctional DNase/RNase
MKAVGGRHLCLLLLAATIAACSCGRSTPTTSSQASAISSDEVRVQVAKVGIDQETGAHYVLLQDDTESRELPIMIGESEAQAIMLSIQGIKPPRPFTHDLMRSIIAETGNDVDRIVIAEMHDEIYYAKIYMDKGRYTIDSRPSDAIALAMGMNAPIYVNPKLLEATLASNPGGGKVPDTARALGITVEQLTPELALYFGEPDGRGVLVSQVSLAAQKAGVARGDIVVKVNDRAVAVLDDFSRGTSALKGDRAVTLTLNRRGSNRIVTLNNQRASSAPSP